MIIKCSRCGFINKADANFCIDCGNNLHEDNNTPQNNTNENNNSNTSQHNTTEETINSNIPQDNPNDRNNNSNSPQNDLEFFAQQLYENKVNLPTRDCPVILKRAEEAVLVLPNITLKEPRAVRTSVGGYAGPTIRIAKGISFRLGGGTSRSVSHDEIKTIDKGTLTITNKRLIFTGSMKTLNYNLSKILSITDFKDGIGIQRDNKQKTEYFR